MTNSDQKVAKVAQIFCCELCDYKSDKKYNFTKHLSTVKHKNQLLNDQIVTISDQKVAKSSKVAKIKKLEFVCNCGKHYKYKQGLSFHKKTCIYDNKNEKIINNDVSQNQLSLSKELILEVVKQQQNQINELTNTIKELIPKVGNNNITNTNNKFNIQVFLNEKCKDAINMSDFIKSIEVSLKQLDYTKEKGFVNGLSSVIIENMNKLGLYERPIHCTDTKRETLYIKDDNSWQKDINKQKIKKAIKDVSTKQFCALNNWTKENPDFQNNEIKQNYYTHTLVAIGNNKHHNEDKIIKKLCTNSYIKN